MFWGSKLGSLVIALRLPVFFRYLSYFKGGSSVVNIITYYCPLP